MNMLKSVYLTLRLDLQLRTKFRLKSRKYGTPSEVLRELISAFVENRLTILPPSTTTTSKEKLYVTRNKD